MLTTMAMGANTLTQKETAIVDLGAAVARGEQAKVEASLKAGFDAGLTLNEAKELVGQLYAYCGFPRALNAAATLKQVWEGRGPSRSWQEGRGPSPFKDGYNALRDGTANQTKLTGRPVAGPLFDFHPQLDEYLKAHLFGDIFARDNVDWRTREIVTIAALAARPETAPQLKAHIAIGKNNGVTDEQAKEIVGRVATCCDCGGRNKVRPSRDWSPIPIGEPNTAYAKYFIGNSYLHKLTLDQVPAFGVTFEPGCRNNWHVHHAKTGGGQILIVTAGEGYYQEWGKPARRLRKGDTVNIPANVKHWHGAAPDSWFQHIALEIPGTETSNEWLEPVKDEYEKLASTANTVFPFTVKGRDGEDVPLADYKGKVLLIVNTATHCGFTPQYEGLEWMYERHKDQGFELLDFPCNQFGQQAPGTDEEIHTFCVVTYKTAFPQFAKIDVNGDNAAPLFKFLTDNTKFEGFPQDGKIAPVLEKMLGEADPDYAKKPDIKWNFTKFLIGRDGRVIRRFEPTAPLSEIETAVEKALQ